jgi:hypothetical protein
MHKQLTHNLNKPTTLDCENFTCMGMLIYIHDVYVTLSHCTVVTKQGRASYHDTYYVARNVITGVNMKKDKTLTLTAVLIVITLIVIVAV